MTKRKDLFDRLKIGDFIDDVDTGRGLVTDRVMRDGQLLLQIAYVRLYDRAMVNGFIKLVKPLKKGKAK
jgi:hypothetical protein